MSGLVAGCVAGISWCFCTATSSLFGSWCGNDKPSTVPPSATSGRKRSVFLLALAILTSFAFQYGLAPALQPDTAAGDAFLGDYFVTAWTGKKCLELAGDDRRLLLNCAGNAGAYRGSFAAFVFFAMFGIAAYCRPTSNREAWPAKYVLFLFLSAATIFIPNDPLFLPIYSNVTRVGSVLFILFQQAVLVDVAYNWNESWLAKAEEADLAEGTKAGTKWIFAILFSCGVLYAGSLAGIVIVYVRFGGCQTNEAFASITLAASILCTIVQLKFSQTGSLLTSATIVAYATYLCGTAVSKNPNGDCNPRLGQSDPWSVALGLIFAGVSLLWAGWSYTADGKMGGRGGGGGAKRSAEEDGSSPVNESSPIKRNVGGVVANDDTPVATSSDPPGTGTGTATADTNDDAAADPARFGNSWKLNAVLAIVCCWYASAMTGWGTVRDRGSAANPDAGLASMWLIISGQWAVLALYLWTLVAPTLFPDRDFS